ncbi:hypothetical protein SRHO_G00092900 [Serrasalmus rhombeus]
MFFCHSELLVIAVTAHSRAVGGVITQGGFVQVPKISKKQNKKRQRFHSVWMKLCVRVYTPKLSVSQSLAKQRSRFSFSKEPRYLMS